MNQFKHAFILIICVSLLTGCWDVIQIEDRGFVAGAAIDLIEDDEKEPLYNITNQFVLTHSFSSIMDGGEDEAEQFQNISAKGRSVYKTDDEMSAMTSKTPYYGHMKLLIMSEELTRKKGTINDFLDHYLRDVNVRREVFMVVSKGKAQDILDFSDSENRLSAIDIRDLLEHSHERSGFFDPFSIGDIEEFNFENRSYVLPYVKIKEQLNWDEGAIIHGPKRKMVGIMNPTDSQGMSIFKGEGKQRIINVNYKGHVLGFEIIRMRRKLNIDTSDISRLKINNKIVVEGIIKEAYNKVDFLDGKELTKVEEAISKKIEESVMKTTDRAQHKWNADILEVWKNLDTKHYDTWKKIKDDWESGENYFSKADVDIEARTYVYTSGTTNRTD